MFRIRPDRIRADRSRARRRLARPVAVAAVAAVAAAGPFAGQASAGSGADRQLPAHLFAPYFQAYQDVSLAGLSRASGARYLTLAFVETPGGGSCEPNWNNDPAKPIAWSTYGSDIADIRARGGDVIPSFGGYSADNQGRELADSCTDVGKIAAAYEKVVTTYGVTRLDMDVEDNSLTNLAGIDRRNKAIALVEQWAKDQGRTVQFVYTLPTSPTGLEDTGKYVLRNAAANGARVDIVNIMTFDYYDNALHDMARDTRTAAEGLVRFLRTLHPERSADQLWRTVGVTEMIGHDDYGSGGEPGPAEVFTLADARSVTAWARMKHLAELSFWALNRDKATDPAAQCALGTDGGDTCSGVAQEPWQFTHIMSGFGLEGRDPHPIRP